MEALRAQVVERVEAMPGGWCKLAKLSGMERAALWRSFKGRKHQPTLTTLLKVAPCLGLKVELTPL